MLDIGKASNTEYKGKDCAIYLEFDNFYLEKALEIIKIEANAVLAKTLEEAVNKFINTENLEFFIFRPKSLSERDLKFILEKTESINPLVKKIVFDVDEKWEELNKDILKTHKVGLVKEEDGVEGIRLIMQTYRSMEEKDRRKYNRIEWPLKVRIKNPKAKETLYNVLSISGNGVFIKSSDFNPNKGDKLLLEIYFKDFKLLTECVVVATNDGVERPALPKGFAATFQNVSTESQKVIDKMIKDKLLKTVLFEYTHVK